jgi:hypothetical protein
MTLSTQQLLIGTRTSGEPVMLDPDERRRHVYIVGQTGTGKSTLLLNLIAQDLAAGEGLALLDPHGDLAEAVLNYVPKVRTNDLVYINPADIERPIGFNPLSSVPHDLKPIVADGVVSAFRHVWPESWGPRLDYILTNAVRAVSMSSLTVRYSRGRRVALRTRRDGTVPFTAIGLRRRPRLLPFCFLVLDRIAVRKESFSGQLKCTMRCTLTGAR